MPTPKKYISQITTIIAIYNFDKKYFYIYTAWQKCVKVLID